MIKVIDESVCSSSVEMKPVSSISLGKPDQGEESR